MTSLYTSIRKQKGDTTMAPAVCDGRYYDISNLIQSTVLRKPCSSEAGLVNVAILVRRMQ